MTVTTTEVKKNRSEVITIGGSDSAIIYFKAINKGKPYEKNVIQLWKQKIGLEIPEEIKEFEVPKIDIGNELESYICRRFINEYPKLKLIDTKEITFHNSEIPFVHANLDGLVEDELGNQYVFEAKTAGEIMKSKWTEESIPDDYYLQVQHYLLVTGLQTAYIAVLFRDSGDYQSYQIDRNDEQIAELVEAYKEFWEHVENKVQPVIPDDELTPSIIKTLYPESAGKEITLPDSVVNSVIKFKQIDAKIKELEKEQEKEKVIIQSAMKDAEKAKIGNFEISWKTSMNIDEDKLKECEPKVYSAYSLLKLDTALIRKEMKDLVGKYLKPGARKFIVKMK